MNVPRATSTEATLINRRLFLRGVAAAAIGSAAPRLMASGSPIRAALIVPRGCAVVEGAEIGAREALHTAKLFDRRFDLTIVYVDGADEAATAAKRQAAGGATAIAGGMSKAVADAIAGAVTIPFLEIRSLDDAGGDADDARYRLTPPASRLKDAVKASGGSGRAVVWHHALNRYGAAELNERFHDATGRAMDSDAWTGWLAMKIILEAALRDREIGAVRIDGHKGSLLRFNAQRVLQQPIYIVTQRDGKEAVTDA